MGSVTGLYQHFNCDTSSQQGLRIPPYQGQKDGNATRLHEQRLAAGLPCTTPSLSLHVPPSMDSAMILEVVLPSVRQSTHKNAHRGPSRLAFIPAAEGSAQASSPQGLTALTAEKREQKRVCMCACVHFRDSDKTALQ